MYQWHIPFWLSTSWVRSDRIIDLIKAAWKDVFPLSGVANPIWAHCLIIKTGSGHAIKCLPNPKLTGYIFSGPKLVANHLPGYKCKQVGSFHKKRFWINFEGHSKHLKITQRAETTIIFLPTIVWLYNRDILKPPQSYLIPVSRMVYNMWAYCHSSSLSSFNSLSRAASFLIGFRGIGRSPDSFFSMCIAVWRQARKSPWLRRMRQNLDDNIVAF